MKLNLSSNSQPPSAQITGGNATLIWINVIYIDLVATNESILGNK